MVPLSLAVLAALALLSFTAGRAAAPGVFFSLCAFVNLAGPRPAGTSLVVMAALLTAYPLCGLLAAKLIATVLERSEDAAPLELCGSLIACLLLVSPAFVGGASQALSQAEHGGSGAALALGVGNQVLLAAATVAIALTTPILAFEGALRWAAGSLALGDAIPFAALRPLLLLLCLSLAFNLLGAFLFEELAPLALLHAGASFTGGA